MRLVTSTFFKDTHNPLERAINVEYRVHPAFFKMISSETAYWLFLGNAQLPSRSLSLRANPLISTVQTIQIAPWPALLEAKPLLFVAGR